MESTRTGPDNWRDAPNGSRIDKEVKKLIKKEGHYPTKFIAKKASLLEVLLMILLIGQIQFLRVIEML